MTVLRMVLGSVGWSEEEVLLGIAASLALSAAVVAIRTADALFEMWPLPLPDRTT